MLRNKFVSMKKELLIVLGVIAVLLILPPVAVLSMTNAKALTDSNSGVTLYTDPVVTGDLYDYGNCTYWVAMRRIQVGEPIPENWGNAADWMTNALFSGYKVDQTPTK